MYSRVAAGAPTAGVELPQLWLSLSQSTPPTHSSPTDRDTILASLRLSFFSHFFSKIHFRFLQKLLTQIYETTKKMREKKENLDFSKGSARQLGQFLRKPISLFSPELKKYILVNQMCTLRATTLGCLKATTPASLRPTTLASLRAITPAAPLRVPAWAAAAQEPSRPKVSNTNYNFVFRITSSHSSVHCTENLIYVFPEKELRGLSPNSYIQHSCVCERFIYSQDRSTCLAAAKWQTDPGNL